MLNGVLAVQLVSTGQSSLLAHLFLEAPGHRPSRTAQGLVPNTNRPVAPAAISLSQASLLLQSVRKAEEGDTER